MTDVHRCAHSREPQKRAKLTNLGYPARVQSIAVAVPGTRTAFGAHGLIVRYVRCSNAGRARLAISVIIQIAPGRADRKRGARGGSAHARDPEVMEFPIWRFRLLDPRRRARRAFLSLHRPTNCPIRWSQHPPAFALKQSLQNRMPAAGAADSRTLS